MLGFSSQTTVRREIITYARIEYLGDFLGQSKNFPTYPERNIPQTPNQQFMVRNSFHLGLKGDAWGIRNRGMLGFPYGEVIKFGNASFPFGYHLKEVMRNHVRTFSQKFGLHEDQLKQSDISPCTHPLLQQYLIICVDDLENQAVWRMIFMIVIFCAKDPYNHFKFTWQQPSSRTMSTKAHLSYVQGIVVRCVKRKRCVSHVRLRRRAGEKRRRSAGNKSNCSWKKPWPL